MCGKKTITGPIDAGESTFMRTMAALQLADSGNITLASLNILKNKSEARRSLVYLP